MRSRFWFILTVLFCFPILTQSQSKTSSPSPAQNTFRVQTELINIDFRLTTKKGDLAQGDFTANDFEVYENGAKQNITNFSPVTGPIATVLLLDYSRQAVIWSAYSQGEIWEGPIQFLRSLQPKDYGAIVIYDMKAYTDELAEHHGVFHDFTKDHQKLEKTLSNIFNSRPAFSESNISDGVKAVLEMLEDNDSLKQRVSLIVVSTGLDTFSKSDFENVLKQAQNVGVTIFPVSIGQHLRILADADIDGSVRMDLLIADQRLRRLAEVTGGEAYFPRFVAEMRGIFQFLSKQLRAQYSLGYVSSNPKRDGKFRKVEIKTNKDFISQTGKKEKLITHHRRGYYAPKD